METLQEHLETKLQSNLAWLHDGWVGYSFCKQTQMSSACSRLDGPADVGPEVRYTLDRYMKINNQSQPLCPAGWQAESVSCEATTAPPSSLHTHCV